MSNSQALKIAVIYGSVRSARQGIKAARFIINKVQQRGHEATLIDTMEMRSMRPMKNAWSSFWMNSSGTHRH